MNCKFLTVLSVLIIYYVQTISADTLSIAFEVYIEDPSQNYPSYPKIPIVPPSVSLEDHTLYFETPCDGCTLNIVDSNDVVVYTLVIPTGATSLVLPSTLSGEFTIEIIRGNYLFYGTIDLP